MNPGRYRMTIPVTVNRVGGISAAWGQQPGGGLGNVTEWEHATFERERGMNAGVPLTAEVVDKAAQALYAYGLDEAYLARYPWTGTTEDVRDTYRTWALAVLLAVVDEPA